MKLLKITTSDGYHLYEQTDGTFTDTQDPNDPLKDLTFNKDDVYNNPFIEIVDYEIYN